ncbi:MAG: MFS transporter [Candidatus Kariarchaeaceae archaeon]|jgi:putative MFS transporter
MSEVEQHFRSKGYMSFLVVWLGIVALVDNSVSLIEQVAIRYIITDYSITLSEFTRLQGWFGILAFFVFIISWLGDYMGRKKGMFVQILIMAVPATLIIPFGSTSLTLFFILYGIMIMGANVNFWAIPISEEAPAKSRGKQGATVFLIGLLPFYALFGETIADSLGWEWTFGLFGILGLIALVPWFFMKETKRWEDNQEEFKKSADTFVSAIRGLEGRDWKIILLNGFIYICWSTAFKFATITLSIYFQDVQGKSFEEWDTILTFGGLMTLVGAITIGQIMDRVGRIPAFAWSVGGSVASFALLALTGLPLFAILIYYFMASVLGFLLVYNAELLRNAVRGIGVGLLSTLSRVGFVAGPLLVSVLITGDVTPDSADAFRNLYLLGAGIMALPFLTLLFNRKETKGMTLEEIEG